MSVFGALLFDKTMTGISTVCSVGRAVATSKSEGEVDRQARIAAVKHSMEFGAGAFAAIAADYFYKWYSKGGDINLAGGIITSTIAIRTATIRVTNPVGWKRVLTSFGFSAAGIALTCLSEYKLKGGIDPKTYLAISSIAIGSIADCFRENMKGRQICFLFIGVFSAGFGLATHNNSMEFKGFIDAAASILGLSGAVPRAQEKFRQIRQARAARRGPH